MKISDLNPEYDKLQQEYGAKELTSIYNGGCTNNPDICFVFMNPTGRNIASEKTLANTVIRCWPSSKNSTDPLGNFSIGMVSFAPKGLQEYSRASVTHKAPAAHMPHTPCHLSLRV